MKLSDGSWAPSSLGIVEKAPHPALEHVLETHHDTRPWADATAPGSMWITTGWGDRLAVPTATAVRWRGDVMLFRLGEQVRVVTIDGELRLSLYEEDLLRHC